MQKGGKELISFQFSDRKQVTPFQLSVSFSVVKDFTSFDILLENLEIGYEFLTLLDLNSISFLPLGI